MVILLGNFGQQPHQSLVKIKRYIVSFKVFGCLSVSVEKLWKAFIKDQIKDAWIHA